jgi:hypothetical protein
MDRKAQMRFPVTLLTTSVGEGGGGALLGEFFVDGL